MCRVYNAGFLRLLRYLRSAMGPLARQAVSPPAHCFINNTYVRTWDVLLSTTMRISIHDEGHTQSWVARGESTSLNVVHRLVIILNSYDSHLY